MVRLVSDRAPLISSYEGARVDGRTVSITWNRGAARLPKRSCGITTELSDADTRLSMPARRTGSRACRLRVGGHQSLDGAAGRSAGRSFRSGGGPRSGKAPFERGRGLNPVTFGF